MPELPEVDVVRQGLEPAITGALIEHVEILDPRSLRRHQGPQEEFVHTLEGARIHAVARRGKFLWFLLENSTGALVCHLGMSGQVRLGTPESDFGPHLRIRFDLVTDSGDPITMGFVDQRIFGSMALDELIPAADGYPGGQGSEQAVIPRSVAHIARDPLDPAFDEKRFSRSLRAKKTEIKRALLDQQLMSGIGNIYADEALWATKLHGRFPTSRMTPGKTRELLAALRAVLTKALGEGGTSFDQHYVNVNGASGYFSHSLNAYGRSGMPCSRCGTIIVREAFMNRSSHRCPSCQRVPRKR